MVSKIQTTKVANNKENEGLFQELQEIKDHIKEVKKFLIFPRGVKKKGVGGSVYPKIISLKISEKKLTTQLSDGRELSIPIAWFAKWGVENVSADKLKKYEIWEGDEIYFPKIDEVVGIESFTKGFDADCE